MIKAAIVQFLSALLLFAPYGAGQNEIPSCPPIPESPEASAPQNMVRPTYPKEALRSGRSGEVELRATIAPTGKLEDLAVLSGSREFSEIVTAAIRKWHFRAVSDEGQQVRTVYKVHVRFNSLLREANSNVELESPVPKLPSFAPSKAPEHSLGELVHRLSEPGIVAPKPLYQPEPEFSEASRKKKEQGNVNIALIVGNDGLARDLKVICSSIRDSNENAIEAVKQWKFSPATKDGLPVAAAIMVEVSFKLYN